MLELNFAIRKKTLSLICFCYLGILSAQVTTGEVVEQNRMLTGFTTIDVDDGIDVYLTPGVNTTVRVKADDYLISKLRTELNGQELKISMDGSYRKPKKLEVHIELPVLEGIAAQGGSDVFTTGSFQLRDFYIRLSKGSELCLNLVAQKVSCNLSGGSGANLQGKVNYFSGDTRGGSILKASELEIQKCKLQALSGSDAYIRVLGELEMEAIESSGIYYQGNPIILYQKASRDSDIRPI